MLSDSQIERYARHLILPEIGAAGQERLLAARVAIVGLGGLGAPAAYYCAAGGIGHLTLIDRDAVDLSNLQRQIIHSNADLGRPKADSAADRIRGLNPECRARPVVASLEADNAVSLLRGHDVVIEGADNFPTKFLVNDVCVRERIPFVHAGVLRFQGQILTVRPGVSACVRCLFRDPPPGEEGMTCRDAGVLGVVSGILGTLQAMETFKLLLGIGEPLTDRLLTVDALTGTMRPVRLRRDPACPACGGLTAKGG